MAIYHCSIKNISRGSGKSAVASASYRSGEKLYSEELNQSFDYTRKQGIEMTGVILCKNAPREYYDREVLWNAVEKVEKASNSRLAREWEVAIPKELGKRQGQELIYNFASSLANEGMCVDFAIHDKGDGNRHAHIMGTTRPIKENGEWGQKEKKAYKLDENGQKIPQIDPQTGEQKIGARGRKMWQRETVEANDWNKTEKIEEWRERWASMCNRYLVQEEQIDHRSYKRQGIEQIPTIHEGYVARKKEKRGEVSERCETNRAIKEYNSLFEKLKEVIKNNAREVIERIRGNQRSLEYGGGAYRGEQTTQGISRKAELREREAEQREQEVNRNYERYGERNQGTGINESGIRERVEILRNVVHTVLRGVNDLRDYKKWGFKGSQEKIDKVLRAIPNPEVAFKSQPEPEQRQPEQKQPDVKPKQESLKDLLARKQAEADKINAEREHQTTQIHHRTR